MLLRTVLNRCCAYKGGGMFKKSIKRQDIEKCLSMDTRGRTVFSAKLNLYLLVNVHHIGREGIRNCLFNRGCLHDNHSLPVTREFCLKSSPASWAICKHQLYTTAGVKYKAHMYSPLYFIYGEQCY